jgi:heparosan-N-sulfate-glucuronate 5-epimerase
MKSKTRCIVLTVSLLIIDCGIGFSQELTRYICITDRIKVESFEKSRTFDKDGIIKSNGKYHPLAICQYGVLSHYRFSETSDSIYYYKFVNQVKYFKDSTKVNHLFDGKGIGLPYNFDFWDLEAPWYSGMTQGYAISFLLRYYTTTKDSSVLEIVKKIAYFLIQPQSEGGTLSKTPEGFTWIEEYPNSNRSPQVLNGFINGLIGLKEYCDFFPEDTAAVQILDETYLALTNSLEYFDSPTWSFYNRKNRHLSNNYLKYQIFQMEHLFDIFKDTVFDHQMRLWSVLSLDKLVKDKENLYIFNNRNRSLPASLNTFSNGTYIDTSLIINVHTPEVRTFRSFRKMKKYVDRKKIRNKSRKQRKTLVSLGIEPTDSIDIVEIQLPHHYIHVNATLFTIDSNLKREYLSQKNQFLLPGNKLALTFAGLPVKNLGIEIKSNKRILLASDSIKMYKTKIVEKPNFGHYQSGEFILEADADYHISLNLIATDHAVIFYKYANDEASLKKSKWKAKNTVQNTFSPIKDGVYIFMVVFDWENALSGIENFDIKRESHTIDNPGYK